jgi:hypothetical protein
MQDREAGVEPVDEAGLAAQPAASASIRGKTLSPAAQRALAEADERRRLAQDVPRPKEINGREGPEPVRYGDWEKNGLASNFLCDLCLEHAPLKML